MEDNVQVGYGIEVQYDDNTTGIENRIYFKKESAIGRLRILMDYYNSHYKTDKTSYCLNEEKGVLYIITHDYAGVPVIEPKSWLKIFEVES